LDAFKRNYNGLDNFSVRARNSIKKAGINFVEGLGYLDAMTQPNGKWRSIALMEETQGAKTELDKELAKFRPDNEEITIDNFFQYSADLLANQSGTLLAIGSTGGIGGATILGVGGAGEKYNQMYQETKDKDGVKGVKYTPLQMAVAPFISGTATGLLSSLPTAKTLMSTKRIFQSAIQEGNVITKEVFDTEPALVEKTKRAIENGSFEEQIKKGKITQENAIKIIQNAGLKIPNFLDVSLI